MTVNIENVQAFEAFLTGWLDYDKDTDLVEVTSEIETSGSELISMYGEGNSESIMIKTLTIALEEGDCPTVIKYCPRYSPQIVEDVKVFRAAIISGHEDVAIMGLKRKWQLVWEKFPVRNTKVWEERYSSGFFNYEEEGDVELYAAEKGQLLVLDFIYNSMWHNQERIDCLLSACSCGGNLEAFKLITEGSMGIPIGVKESVYINCVRYGDFIDILRYCFEELHILPVSLTMTKCLMEATSADMVRYLVSVGANMDSDLLKVWGSVENGAFHAFHPFNGLSSAATTSSVGLLQYHLETGLFDVNEIDENGNCALYYALKPPGKYFGNIDEKTETEMRSERMRRIKNCINLLLNAGATMIDLHLDIDPEIRQYLEDKFSS